MPSPGSLGFVLVASAGTRVQLSAAQLLVWVRRFEPCSANAVANVGNVYLYQTKTGGTAYAILSPYQTDSRTLGAAPPRLIDLSEFWLDADNSGDGMLVGYET